jgi:hypothetical protein
MVEDKQEYKRKWHNTVERCILNICVAGIFVLSKQNMGIWTSKRKTGTTIPSVSERIITRPLNWQKNN